MNPNLFEGIEIDPKQRDQIRSLPAAERTVVIFFTPRSGSSWLTDILAQTKKIGQANELFNPNFLRNSARALQADNLDDYIYAARRRLNAGSVFSFEITMHQLNAIFESKDDFHRRFGNGKFVWLTRRDIVSQAVSLAKMVRARIAHSPHVTVEDVATADRTFDCSDAEIRKWIGHIRKAEKQTEAFLAKHRICPLRLVYESMIERGAEESVRQIALHAGVQLRPESSITERHRKVGTVRNAELAARFTRRNRLLILRLAWQRRKLFSDVKNIV